MKKTNADQFLSKVKKYLRIAKIAATAAVVAMSVYNLIPKSEKINGIDTKKFVDNVTSAE